MYKTFAFNENAPNEILKGLVGDRKFNKLSDALNYLLTEHKYRQINSEHLKKFLEEVFWASTFTEERNFHLPSVALTPSVSVAEEHLEVGKKYKFRFATPIPFNAKNLAKLSTAMEDTEHHLGAWIDENNNLQIRGFTMDSQFLAKAIELGQILLIKRGANYKIERKILIDNSDITFIKNFDSIFPTERQNVFTRLAKYIRNHNRGGTLLVVSGNVTIP